MGTLAEGRDIYCRDSLVTGRYARGKELLAQRCYHRLSTPAGDLRGGEEEADFGLDLAGFVGRIEDAQLATMLPVMVRNELRKDPAVDAVDVAAARTVAGAEVSWTLTIDITSTDGDVSLIVAVDGVSVELLGVT